MEPTLVHTFDGSDGFRPGGGDLIWDQQGDIYGVTSLGGAGGQGVVFQLTGSGNTWTETPIYSFKGNGGDGANPYGGLVMNGNGNLFGTTENAGPLGRGTVFELSYVVGVGWQEKLIYSFNSANDGGNPVAGLISDSAGNLYGATLNAGPAGGGTVFELSPSGDSWTFHLLYSLVGAGNCGPQASLSMDAAGNLYGTTLCDGANTFGSVFKLTNTGNGWTYASLHDFTGGDDARYPYSNVTIDADGNLYGTAEGANFSEGVVWMIKP